MKFSKVSLIECYLRIKSSIVMLKTKLTYLILSCDKFSDLWDGNINLFHQNWPDGDFDVFLVTDKETDRVLPGVNIISAGDDMEWSDRLKFAMNYVKTQYVFVTLDDYFLIKKVNNDHIKYLVNLMEKNACDYIRLFKNPTKATGDKVAGEYGLYNIKSEVNYSVNLYPGIWSKTFFEYCLKDSRTAWMFEVTLHECAIEYGANCIVSYNEEYTILDVVRKGRLLRNAVRYFKTHPGIYVGSREVQSLSFELKLFIKTFIQEHIPAFLFKIVRFIYVKCGGQSFTYQRETEKKCAE